MCSPRDSGLGVAPTARLAARVAECKEALATEAKDSAEPDATATSDSTVSAKVSGDGVAPTAEITERLA